MSNPQDQTQLLREAFSLFDRFLDLQGEARQHELQALATTRPDLYPHIVTLLRAAEQADADNAFDTLPSGVSQIRFEAPKFEPDTQWGPYRFEHILGAGGMGEVWLANRTDGLYEGKVAIKVLHPHLSQAGLRERFAREGQILGKLAHPHIARLLDAGVASNGPLFLVLEYVEGERIDRWCDERKLDLRSRLKLFLDVCSALAHAHSHLVVHRDLKPSNILVDNDGQVKLLDFGIAKLLEGEEGAAGQATELTRLSGRALTPEYAAPEQIRSEAITTVTDVYSLGVLLYLLLCGQRPYGSGLTTPTQLERAVLEIDPRAPSQMSRTRTRASEGEADHHLQRQIATPKKLAKALRGDLDNIVGKALKKNPAERYPSVLALANDIQRYLDDEPVSARRDSFGYRTSKFVRRHQLAAAATLLILLLIVAGVVGTSWQAHVATLAEKSERHERELVEIREAELQQVVDFQGALLKRVDVLQLGTGWLDRMRQKVAEHLDHDKPLPPDQAAQALADFDRMRPWSQPSEVARQTLGTYLLAPAEKEIATRFGTQPGSEATLRFSLGQAYADLGLYADARKQFERVVDLRTTLFGPEAAQTLGASLMLADMQARMGDIKGAILRVSQIVEVRSRTLGDDHRDTLKARSVLGSLEFEAADQSKALALLRPTLQKQQQLLGPDDPDTLTTLHLIGNALTLKDDNIDALQPFKQAYEGRLRVLGPDNPDTLGSLQMLANIEHNLNDDAGAQAHFEQLIAARRRILGDQHPSTLKAESDLADVVDDNGDFKRAVELKCEVYADLRTQLGADTMPATISATNCALILNYAGRTDEAREIMEQVVAVRTRLLGAENPRTLFAMNNLARVMRMQKQFGAAEKLERQVLEIQRRVVGPEVSSTLQTWQNFAQTLHDEGRDAEAVKEYTAMSEVYRKAVGPEDFAMLDMQSHFGSALRGTGDFEGSRALIESTLETERRVLPEHNWYSLVLTAELAKTLHALHRDEEAHRLIAPAVDAMRSQMGQDAPDVIDAAATLASIDASLSRAHMQASQH